MRLSRNCNESFVYLYYMKPSQDTITTFDFSLFMETIGFFPMWPFDIDSYTNSDWQIHFKPEENQLKITNMPEDSNEQPMFRYIPMPTTINQAVDSLNLMFNDEWSDKEKKEIYDEYFLKLLFSE
jgi:hypothetical protein